MISTTMPSDPEEDYIPWIQQFCELFGHDYFVQVSQDFIEDDFNLTGLSLQVPYYREALYTILITKLKRQKIITLTIQPPIPAITMIHGMVQVNEMHQNCQTKRYWHILQNYYMV